MTAARPAAVERLAEALADWLASFTVPAALGAEMAEACAAGSEWVAAIGASAVRRAGWTDAEALAWGIAAGGLAGALEAGRASLAQESADSRSREAVAAADGPARVLLAADGLIAAAHEALGALAPDRLQAALRAVSGEFGDGGPWRRLSVVLPRPAWAALVPCALAPAAAEQPAGPWAVYEAAWRGTYGRDSGDPPPGPPNPGGKTADPARVAAVLWDHPAADAATRALLRAAAREARAAAHEAHAEV